MLIPLLTEKICSGYFKAWDRVNDVNLQAEV